jgi:predicted phosphoribosyltransferase
MFKDRKDAGLQLAEALSPLKHEEPLILAIPIGGVVLGFHVAKKLECDFSVIICRKLGFPAQPEAAYEDFRSVNDEDVIQFMNLFEKHLNKNQSVQ